MSIYKVIALFYITQAADTLWSEGTIVLTIGANDEFLTQIANGNNNHWTNMDEALSRDGGILARFQEIINQHKIDASVAGREEVHGTIRQTHAEGVSAGHY